MPQHTSDLTIGIDLGGTNIQGGILAGDGKIIARKSTKTKADKGPEAVIERIGKVVDGLLDKAGMKADGVLGLGIGAPGVVDVTRGVVIEAVNLRWNDFPLVEKLGAEVNLPVVVDNDVNVGAWGEFAAGAGKPFDDMMAVFVGTGIGGGLIFGGELFHGALMSAGEIGHTVIDADAGLGRRTVENLASRNSLVNLLGDMIDSNYKSVVSELSGGDMSKVRSKIIAQAFEKEDPLTREVVAQAARYIGVAVANSVTLLSLPCVVIGGGLTEALGKPWLEMIQESFDHHVFPHHVRKCEIVVSQLGDDAGVIGAALLARQNLRAKQAHPV